jgi:transcriptional regulator with XRE-family HTH domain
MPKRDPLWNMHRMNLDRVLRGWSHKDLATEAGVDRSTVTRFFLGQHRTPKVAKKIALALGYPLSRYVRDDEQVAS